MAAKKKDWGSILGAVVLLLVTLAGWVITESGGYLLAPGGTPELEAGGIPELEIASQIEELNTPVLYIAYVVVRNQGTGTARNCVVRIEDHAAQETEYEFLGYAYFEEKNFSPHTESRFGLLLVESDDDGAHWKTWITLRDIRDYVPKENSVIHYPIDAGDYYIKLTMIADNAESSSREFKLRVSQDGTELPKLEDLSQNQVQDKH